VRVFIITEMPNWGEDDDDMAGHIRAVVVTREQAMDKLVELEERDEDAVFIAQQWEVLS
jgi:hypothetical protein